jgi:LTXXQ motif family protein
MRKLLLLPVMIGLSAGLVAATPTFSPSPAQAADETGAARPSHIEGRIAYLQAELHITAEQMPLWNAVADVLRQNDQASRAAWAALRDNADDEVGAVDRLTQMQKMAASRADNLGKLLAAVKPLYEAMSVDQKKSADELLASRFGKMHHWHS